MNVKARDRALPARETGAGDGFSKRPPRSSSTAASGQDYCSARRRGS